MRRLILATSALICLGFAAWAVTAVPQKKTVAPSVADAPAKLFNAETFTLDNGLEIVVIPNHRAPVVTHMLWYKVGAADETTGKSGIAHFLEHLMFKGSEGLAPGEFSKIIRARGGVDNASTSQDYTNYFQSIASEHLEMVMTMEAGRMRGLNPPIEHVESERKVILEERRQRTDDSPGARLNEQINALLYINHPYGKPVIGWASEMADLSWDDAKTFYDRWYAPNNAILIVSGDVTGQQVYDLAKKIYGPLQRVDVPVRKRTISPPLKGDPEVALEDPNVRQPTVQIEYRAPSSRQNKKEALALQVLEEILGGGPASRFYRSLVMDQKIATGADFSYDSTAWDDGTVVLAATPADGQDLKNLKKALEDQLRLLLEKGVEETELNAAKTRMQAASIYSRDSLEDPARIFGYALTAGLTVDDIEYWPANIAKVTTQDVMDAAKKYLDPDAEYDHSPVTGYLLPQAKPPVEAPPAEAAP